MTTTGCVCLYNDPDNIDVLQYTLNCPVHRCGKMVYQDDSRIRCCLERGHLRTVACQELPPVHRLDVQSYKQKREIYEEDPNFKSISRGDGMYFTVPTWVAEILERHADEII